MRNSHFSFKNFRIEQGNCANKVSTDACVFGAIIAPLCTELSVLEIGTGTGVLALMLAQEGASVVLSIELEEACANQAKENVHNSTFSKQIEIICADARKWKSGKLFDYVISNPPFFNNTFKSSSEKRNLARQNESLAAGDWKSIIEKNLKEDGIVVLLLSNNDVLLEYKKELRNNGLSVQKEILLFDKANVPCKRVILFASRQEIHLPLQKQIIYKEEDGNYTEEMKNLLKNYYLYL
ncbi:MAG: methyltransferase [Chitinophagales bacterium]